MTDTREIIDKVAYALEPIQPVNYAFLFGSALNRLLPQSDIDILIGGEIDFDLRMLLTAKLYRELSRKVDLVLVREARCELVLKAMSQGLQVFVRNRDILKHDYFANRRCFDDSTNLRKIRFSRIRRQYANG
jgi:predicted nucleotidyltransferase